MNHIPMLDLKAEYLYMKDDVDAAIARCLEHQQWIFGPEVSEFEKEVAQYIGAKHCIGTSSGTDALVLALRALAIKRKGEEYFDRSDLIITTPFTFTATGDAILRAGATPVFVDIDRISYNIDPGKIREALGSSEAAFDPSDVVGILPVHLYGQSCEMDEIIAIAREHGLFVVEDCAQAFGSKWQMKNGNLQTVGSIGDIGCFSFFPSKNLGGFGDAGAITTNDDELAGLIRMLIKHGGKDKYNVDHVGYNARLDTLQAAVLLAKLKHIDDFNDRRRQIAQLYTEGLRVIEGLVLPLAPRPSPLALKSHVFHQFTVGSSDGKRESLQAHLKDAKIDSMVYYPIPLHKMKLFERRSEIIGSLENAENASRTCLSLPMKPLWDELTTKVVIKVIKEFYYNREK